MVGHDAVGIDEHAGLASMRLEHVDRISSDVAMGEDGATIIDSDGDGAEVAGPGVVRQRQPGPPTLWEQRSLHGSGRA